jgi:hypothetical protein
LLPPGGNGTISRTGRSDTLRGDIARQQQRRRRKCEFHLLYCYIAMNYATNFKSIRDQVSAEEWQARVELAACYRLMDCFGMTDLIYNHITARVPGTGHHLLINLYGLLYREITASSLVKIDIDGEVLWKPESDYASTSPAM